MPDVEPDAREDMPQASVELDVLWLMVEAYLIAEGPKKAQRLLATASRILSEREGNFPGVVQFLPAKERESRERVRRQTKAWFRAALQRWITTLGEE